MYVIGNKKIKEYQGFIIVLGIIISSLFFIFHLIYKTPNTLFMFIFCVLFFIGATVYYCMFYLIKVDVNFFYMENLFKKGKIPTNEFNKIKVVSIMPYIISISFKNKKRYFFMLDSFETFKAILKSNKNTIENNLTNKINNIIAAKE